MLQLIGEYECKIDAKARVMLPAALKKQLIGSNADKFVVNRGFEKHLTLYPYEVWQTESAEVNKLNMYNKGVRLAKEFRGLILGVAASKVMTTK